MSQSKQEITKTLSMSQQQVKEILDDIEQSKENELCFASVSIKIDKFNPNHEQLRQIYLAASIKSLNFFLDLPKEHKTPHFCLQLLKVNPSIGRLIPSDVLNNYDIQFELVRHSFFGLEETPIAMRDEKLCAAAINQYFANIAHVPDEFLDKEPFKTALKEAFKVAEHGYIEYLPDSKRTLKICLNAVSKSWQQIEMVPPIHYDNKGFKSAIKQWQDDVIKNPVKIKKAPIKLLSQEVCNAIIRKDRQLFQFIPAEFRNLDLCSSVIESQGPLTSSFLDHLLRDMKVKPDSFQMSSEEFSQIYIKALKSPWLNSIKEIPKDYLSHDLISKAVKERSEVLKHLDEYETTTSLTRKEFIEICEQAISDDPYNIDFIPKKYRDMDLYTLSVKTRPVLLEHLAPRHNIGMSDSEYRALCLACVKSISVALEYVPPEFRDFILFKNSVENSGFSLRFIGPEDIKKLSKQEYIDLCIAAIQSDPFALEHVEESFKSDVINHLTPEWIIGENFGTIDFFPKGHNYHKAIENTLKKVKHVILTDEDSTRDREVKDSRLVYANSPKRSGTVIHAHTSKLNNLFQALTVNTNECFNLVLLSHAFSDADKMAGLSPTEVTNILTEHKNINRITLLGCNSVQSQQLQQEKEMIKTYRKTTDNFYAGVIICKEKPDIKQAKKILSKLKSQSKKQNHGSILVYVSGEKSLLITLQYDDKDEVIETCYNLNKKQVKELAKLIGKNGRIPSPTKNQPILYQRFRADNILSYEQTCDILDVARSQDRFTRGHDDYKNISKKHYPFLTGVEIQSPEEIEKIQQSYLRKVIDAINIDPKITRGIKVKGYSEPLHVDAKEGQIKTSRTHLYKGKYQQSFFNQPGDIIDRKKLRKDRLNKIKKLSRDNVDEKQNTVLKSITVLTGPW